MSLAATLVALAAGGCRPPAVSAPATSLDRPTSMPVARTSAAAAPSSMPATPSSAPAAPSSAHASVPTDRPGCQGQRLALDEVLAGCQTSRAQQQLPAQVAATLAGPPRIAAGATQRYELRLVNRETTDLPVVVSFSCRSSLSATDARGSSTERREHTTFGQTSVRSCGTKPTTVAVVLAPGGMLIEPLEWTAEAVHFRDDVELSRSPLAPGRYTLKLHTWLRQRTVAETCSRMPDGERSCSRSYIPISASLPIRVVPAAAVK